MVRSSQTSRRRRPVESLRVTPVASFCADCTGRGAAGAWRIARLQAKRAARAYIAACRFTFNLNMGVPLNESRWSQKSDLLSAEGDLYFGSIVLDYAVGGIDGGDAVAVFFFDEDDVEGAVLEHAGE